MKKEKKKRSKSEIGKRSKAKGSRAELHYVTEFKKLGYEHCITSRLGSKLYDSVGIDLLFIPYNVQIKAGKQVGLRPEVELKYIKDRIEELFPPDSIEFDYPKILIHRRDVGRGYKRDEFHDTVHMTFKDFYTILEELETLRRGISKN